jgi:hypothetical protein
MRTLCGLGLAALVSGTLAAQHHGGSGSGRPGAAIGGIHSGARFAHAATVVMIPHAYPLAYSYGPPQDASYTAAYAPPPDDSAGQWSGPQYAAAAPPPPPPHSLILNMEDMEAGPPAEPAHYYIALKDHHIYLAVAYWVEGSTLHYFLPGNTHNQVSVSLVDKDLTARLNRESGTEVKLP